MPEVPKSIVASAFSAAPAVDTTVPRPKVSWLTRSPGSRSMTTRLPGERVVGRSARAAEAGGCETVDATRSHSTSSSGTSAKNRDGGLYDGAPHAERITARDR